MNRFISAYINYYGTMREDSRASSFEFWQKRFRATNAEFNAAWDSLLRTTYPLAFS